MQQTANSTNSECSMGRAVRQSQASGMLTAMHVVPKQLCKGFANACSHAAGCWVLSHPGCRWIEDQPCQGVPAACLHQQTLYCCCCRAAVCLAAAGAAAAKPRAHVCGLHTGQPLRCADGCCRCPAVLVAAAVRAAWGSATDTHLPVYCLLCCTRAGSAQTSPAAAVAAAAGLCGPAAARIPPEARAAAVAYTLDGYDLCHHPLQSLLLR